MEIRPKVTEYVRLRLENLRKEYAGEYQNGSVIKTNAMKYLPNFFYKGQLDTVRGIGENVLSCRVVSCRVLSCPVLSCLV